MHNLKGYDGLLIGKALKNEFGEARVIPQNMEIYLSITVDRLKFIYSLQFTPQSLDSLVKTLEVAEFKYAREAFPIQHECKLIKWEGVYPYCFFQTCGLKETDLATNFPCVCFNPKNNNHDINV